MTALPGPTIVMISEKQRAEQLEEGGAQAAMP